MLDYCLFFILLQNDLNTYKIFGNYFELHAKNNQLIQSKLMKEDDNPELVLIYKESNQFIENYWKNILSDCVKWLIIVPQDQTSAIIIFKELRAFGKARLILDKQPIILIKDLKPNFKSYYRQDMLLPINDENIDDFLNIKLNKHNLEDCCIATGDKEQILNKCLTTSAPYIYFGEHISENNLSKLKSLFNAKIKIIECVNFKYQTVGFFVDREHFATTYIYSIEKISSLKNILKFKQLHLKAPVY